MAITFSCECGKPMQAKDEYAGRRTKCTACGKVLVIPKLEPLPEPAYDLENPATKAAFAGPERSTAGSDRFAFPPVANGMGNTSSPMPSLPIKIQEDELATGWPPSSSLGSAGEPWFYGFLEKYANFVQWLGIILSGCLFIPILLAYVGVNYRLLAVQNEFVSLGMKLLYFIGGTLAFLVAVLMVLLVVLVPTLFAVALIHIVVDSGRNLRAIRAELEAKQ